MAHFDENANFYPTIPTAENFNIYSHFYPMPDAGAETIQPLDNFENWNLAEQCGLFFDPLAVAPVPNSYGWEVPEISYPTQSEDYTQPTYPGQYIPEVQPQPQYSIPQFSSLSGWDGCVATGVASEPPPVVPAPSISPLGCLGENTSGYPLNTFPENVYIPYQPNAGPDRTTLGQRMRFQPYERNRTHLVEYVNTEAGSSTLVPPHNTSVGPPATQPPGGNPETLADAKNNSKNAEDKVPRPKPAKRKNYRYREKTQAGIPILLRWAQRRKFLRDPPTINAALAIAAEAISNAREMVNQGPYLKLFGTKCDSGTISMRTRKERERRTTERRLYQELSKYYPRERGPWTIPTLLSRVVEDLETHSELKQDPSGWVPTMPVWIPRRMPGTKFFIATTGF